MDTSFLHRDLGQVSEDKSFPLDRLNQGLLELIKITKRERCRRGASWEWQSLL